MGIPSERDLAAMAKAVSEKDKDNKSAGRMTVSESGAHRQEASGGPKLKPPSVLVNGPPTPTSGPSAHQQPATSVSFPKLSWSSQSVTVVPKRLVTQFQCVYSYFTITLRNHENFNLVSINQSMAKVG